MNLGFHIFPKTWNSLIVRQGSVPAHQCLGCFVTPLCAVRWGPLSALCSELCHRCDPAAAPRRSDSSVAGRAAVDACGVRRHSLPVSSTAQYSPAASTSSTAPRDSFMAARSRQTRHELATPDTSYSRHSAHARGHPFTG